MGHGPQEGPFQSHSQCNLGWRFPHTFQRAELGPLAGWGGELRPFPTPLVLCLGHSPTLGLTPD